jgi:hypothetical protein
MNDFTRPKSADELLVDGRPVFGPCEADFISDDDIDWDAIARNSAPGTPGGRIIFSTADYATEEEAMAALEAMFIADLMGDDDEEPAAT